MRRHKWELLTDKHISEMGLQSGISRPVPLERISAYALIIEDTPILVLALMNIAPGTVCLSLYPGKHLYSKLRKTLVAIRGDTDNYMVLNSINRLEANTPDTPRFRSFMKRFGFKVEFPMEKFFNGETYLMWVRFQEKI